MIKIGLTGGIGAGKSVVSKIIEDLGYPVFNSDNEAKFLMENDEKVVQAIKDLFGEEAYTENQLNRKHLADLIFTNETLKNDLNAIVHPAVRNYFKTWSEEQNSELVFNEAAILFETGRYKDFDYTILVTAPEEVRIQRVIARDNASYEEVKNRINNQWSDEEKIPLASFIIENDKLETLQPQIEKILEEIKS